jgi:MerR family transcriptional regulator, redox-sensitive transcriptional activator SoxR
MSADDSKQLSIGELSTRTGKARSAIRYYEEIGLIPAPIRIGGRRRYPVETIRTLAVIETAQRATLTLDEIRLLLRASADDRLAIDGLRVVAERKLPEVEALIVFAGVVQRWLEAARECTCPTFEDCPLFEAAHALPDRVGAHAAVGQRSVKGVDRGDSALR